MPTKKRIYGKSIPLAKRYFGEEYPIIKRHWNALQITIENRAVRGLGMDIAAIALDAGLDFERESFPPALLADPSFAPVVARWHALDSAASDANAKE